MLRTPPCLGSSRQRCLALLVLVLGGVLMLSGCGGSGTVHDADAGIHIVSGASKALKLPGKFQFNEAELSPALQALTPGSPAARDDIRASEHALSSDPISRKQVENIYCGLFKDYATEAPVIPDLSEWIREKVALPDTLPQRLASAAGFIEAAINKAESPVEGGVDGLIAVSCEAR